MQILMFAGRNADAQEWNVEERLKQHTYVAIGEFHVSGADADLSIVRRIALLAKQHGLMLHVHGDVNAVERLFR